MTFVPQDENPEIKCTICQYPADTPVEVVPCKHVFCQTCLAKSAEKCPNCRQIITHHGPAPEKVRDQAAQVVGECDGCIKVIAGPCDSPPLAAGRRVQQVSPASNAGAQPPATGGAPVAAKTIIFWDYDNINQSKCGRGVSTTAFLVKLVQFLKEKGVMPGSSWDAHAYFVNGVAYPENVIEACSKLQIERHLCSKKRQAADRELQKNMRQAAEHRKATGSDDRIVLISDDGDFIETVKELASNFRCPVTVIHHAQGDHLLHLQAHAQATFDIAELFPAFTGLSFAGGAGTTANAKAGTMILVNNERHDVATLVPNRQVDFLIKNPSISGGMCRSTESGHDAMKCKYVHKIASNANANAPAGTVNLEGNQVSVAGLVANRATHYLLANPNKRGQYCSPLLNQGRFVPSHRMNEYNGVGFTAPPQIHNHHPHFGGPAMTPQQPVPQPQHPMPQPQHQHVVQHPPSVTHRCVPSQRMIFERHGVTDESRFCERVGTVSETSKLKLVVKLPDGVPKPNLPRGVVAPTYI